MAAMTITASSFLKTSFPVVCLPTATHSPSRASTRRVAAICNSISSSTPPYDLNCFKFNPMKESVASREMTRRYMTDMIADVNTDVIIIGTGSAGLSCAYELSKDPSVNIAIVERSVSPGGSGWLGSQLFSAMVVRKPAHLLLDEINIEYDEQEDYVVIKHAALFTSTLLSRLLAQPNVKLFNAVVVEDLVVKENRVAGVITNWALASMNQDIKSHIDPNVMEGKIVVSSCGHEGLFSANGVKRLEDIGTINTMPRMKALDVNTAEDAIVSLTREVVPGMIVAGIEVAEIDGPHRMLPTFGATIISGQKAAHLALKALGRPNDIDEQRYSRESRRYTRRLS
ncbi:thiamine thiazole synthase 2, chloroplastic-like [Hordeum vulgare subsp. vulgare]|uniref:thiamine thiazole synthase 2, chloroplastic-like n=1 Tax=Hordeum vulgare subsp. vulgare TaxID=112509 RepID=UPI001D1A3B5B|nr:thiamine thiazole synthase 2, chloroplastic-like [Hordeum vulgare subsp. vulgare]